MEIMNIGIFTICYNNYGEFALRWCTAISQSTVMPEQATIALFGDKHGLSNENAAKCAEILPCLNIVHCGEHTNIGTDRNRAIENIGTEWLMLVSIDDILLSGGVEDIQKHASQDVDVIAISYKETKPWGLERIKIAPNVSTRKRIFTWRDNWISPCSPFRRSFWEKSNYINGEYPNVPMFFDLCRNGARFTRTDFPCIWYIMRSNTHSSRESVEEIREIEYIIDSYAEPEVSDINQTFIGDKKMTDIYQQRYLKHRLDKKNTAATDKKPEYTDLEIMTIFKIMHERRSQRLFNDDDIDTDRLKGIMKAAELAPSSCNRKAVRTELIKSEHDISQLSKLLVGGSGWLENANAVVLLLADMRAYKSPAEVGFMPFLDAGVIAQNIYLIGEALGVGVCFINPNIRESDKEEFDSSFLPDGYRFCGALALGNYDLREVKHA